MAKFIWTFTIISLSFMVAAMVESSAPDDSTACFVYSDKVVINEYVGKKLMSSSFLSNQHFVRWQKNMGNAVQQIHQDGRRFINVEYQPFNENEGLLQLRQVDYPYQEWHISAECSKSVERVMAID